MFGWEGHGRFLDAVFAVRYMVNLNHDRALWEAWKISVCLSDEILALAVYQREGQVLLGQEERSRMNDVNDVALDNSW